MLARLTANWVYGGAMAGILLLVLAPLLTRALSPAGTLCYLALPVYMLHQWEEHDGDRFRLYINGTVAKGRAGLTHGDVFIVNIVAVWALFAAALWLTEDAGPGWALVPIWLILVNGVIHLLPAALRRRYNPGAWTALVLFLPFGLWSLARLAPQAGAGAEAGALALALAIHLAIMARAMRPVAARP